MVFWFFFWAGEQIVSFIFFSIIRKYVVVFFRLFLVKQLRTYYVFSLYIWLIGGRDEFF